MSWLLNLYKTYESNVDSVGIVELKRNGQEYTLLPTSHTTQNAHIEVEITENGEFHSATLIQKNDASTLIPCTEESSSRAGSKIAPYPLHDKLIYVAGDFVSHGGKIKKEEPFTYYIKQLERWANSSFSNEKVKSIYKYLSKKQLIKDLVKEKILFLAQNGNLIDKWDKSAEKKYGEKPPIFSLITGGPESAFVRFNVYSTEKELKSVWKDKEMYDSFIQFYKNQLAEKDLCYVTGENLPSTERHANKIRNSGDKAKLISANDSSGFTFRGRFSQGTEVAAISYDASQKAHNALKWLINKQGKIIDNRVFLVWENGGKDVPSPTDDSYDLGVLDYFSSNKDVFMKGFTNEVFAREFSKALDGFRSQLDSNSDSINIMILDSATTGRLAILYYRSIDKEEYFNHIKKWHLTCIWRHTYRKDKGGKTVAFIGAPATRDIAFAAYGPHASDKIVKGLMERMLPCIVDDRRIPTDIVRSVLYRASNPVSLEKWEWEKTLSIACALINRQEEYNVPLDHDNNDRDYLFGRLLAIADVLERRALGSEEGRSTNAIRYMNSFSRHPERTWNTIQSSLQPYQARMGIKARYLSSLIDEVASRFKTEDFNNKPLSGKYLLGFYSQRHELYQKKNNTNELKEE